MLTLCGVSGICININFRSYQAVHCACILHIDLASLKKMQFRRKVVYHASFIRNLIKDSF